MAVFPGPAHGPRAHDIRGASASTAFLFNVSIGFVLRAASWSSPSIFCDFYLKDIACTRRGVSSLGPFVAADLVIDGEG